MPNEKQLSIALSGLFVVLAAGCSGSSTLSVSARAGSRLASGKPAASASVTSGDTTIERVRIVVRELELKGSGSGIEGSGPEVELPPFLMDLTSFDGGVHKVTEVTIPDGDYREVEFKIDTVNDNQATSQGLKDMAALHASIAVDYRRGTSTGQFTTPMEIEQEREGDFGVHDGDQKNITFLVDPSGWFVGANTLPLDPGNPADRGQILENIRRSIRVFEDDDHDGEDDECECEDHPDDSSGSGSSSHSSSSGSSSGDRSGEGCSCPPPPNPSPSPMGARSG